MRSEFRQGVGPGDSTPLVTPAKAGVHRGTNTVADEWTPAFAGVTIRVCGREKAPDPTLV